MNNFISIKSIYTSATFFVSHLFCCLRYVTLVKVSDQKFYVHYKARINVRAVSIILFRYFCGNYSSNFRLNLYLFNRAIFVLKMAVNTE